MSKWIPDTCSCSLMYTIGESGEMIVTEILSMCDYHKKTNSTGEDVYRENVRKNNIVNEANGLLGKSAKEWRIDPETRKISLTFDNLSDDEQKVLDRFLEEKNGV